MELERSRAISAAELERMMKLQDVILKAMAKKITWLEAAEIIGVCDRTMRRIRERYQVHGTTGCSTNDDGNGPPCGCRWNKPSECWRCIETLTSI